jgi:DNA polymerase-3 subunit epsilon
MRRVYLDVATTGMELNDRIIEIALIEEINGELTGYRYNCLVNPEGRLLTEAAKSVTGHRDDQLKQFPVFSVLTDSILRFIADADLVCWDVTFDIAFLNHELKLQGKPNIHLITECTIGLDVKSRLKKQGYQGRLRDYLSSLLNSQDYDHNLTWLQSNCEAMAKLHKSLVLI